MAKVRDGDPEKLGLLYERYKRPLLGFFVGMVRDRELGEDLVQNTFVRILKYRHLFRARLHDDVSGGERDGDFRTWMYHIARHARVDFLRKRRGEIEWDDAYAAPVMPGDPAEAAQHRRCLALALQRLPDDKREVLVLSRFQGLRYDAIGQLLKCEPGAVKVRVHRAMRELREQFHQIAQGQIAQGQIVKGEKL